MHFISRIKYLKRIASPFLVLWIIYGLTYAKSTRVVRKANFTQDHGSDLSNHWHKDTQINASTASCTRWKPSLYACRSFPHQCLTKFASPHHSSFPTSYLVGEAHHRHGSFAILSCDFETMFLSGVPWASGGLPIPCVCRKRCISSAEIFSPVRLVARLGRASDFSNERGSLYRRRQVTMVVWRQSLMFGCGCLVQRWDNLLNNNGDSIEILFRDGIIDFYLKCYTAW